MENLCRFFLRFFAVIEAPNMREHNSQTDELEVKEIG